MRLKTWTAVLSLALLAGCGSPDTKTEAANGQPKTAKSQVVRCTSCGEESVDRDLKECPNCKAPLAVWGKEKEKKKKKK